MTSQRRSTPAWLRHSELQRRSCHSEPQARNLRRLQCRDPSRSLGMTSRQFPLPGFAIPSRNAAVVIPHRKAPLSFRTATPLLSFRAAGEESQPFAMPKSLAFARDDDGESFQARCEESPPLAAPGSLALLGMTEPVAARATRTCGVAMSRACAVLNNRAAGFDPRCSLLRLKRKGRLRTGRLRSFSFDRDDRRWTSRAEGEKSPVPRRRDPSSLRSSG
jgi:hypothetical protein